MTLSETAVDVMNWYLQVEHQKQVYVKVQEHYYEAEHALYEEQLEVLMGTGDQDYIKVRQKFVDGLAELLDVMEKTGIPSLEVLSEYVKSGKPLTPKPQPKPEPKPEAPRMYKISIRNHGVYRSQSDTPQEAFGRLFPNIVLTSETNPQKAVVCTELLNGAKESKNYYTVTKKELKQLRRL